MQTVHILHAYTSIQNVYTVDTQRCSIASRCGLSSRTFAIEKTVCFFCCPFCVRAGKQITQFDVGRVFHLSAIIKVAQPKEAQGRAQGLKPFGQGIQEEAIRGASVEN